ncbi:MAG: protein kinase [Candidatus Pacearchaeota archaeon]|jgi:serine/threonine protein kinase
MTDSENFSLDENPQGSDAVVSTMYVGDLKKVTEAAYKYLKEEDHKLHALTSEDISELKNRGYEILQELGEGQTRIAYLARYSQGEVSKPRVVKIPKTEISPDSICTIINKHKRDVDLAEVHISNQIQHPNIVEVVDNFKLRGKTVNVETYYEGESLEDRVKTTGVIKDHERFTNIFSQIINAVRYLNEEKYILHRDIKPSNINITRNGVKLSDLQNAARIRDISEISMPTRGGTAYTHPTLLNALVLGKNACASERTEVYALGGTMLYALTGINPFNYGISSDENGKPLKVGDKIYKIKLTSGGTSLEEITSQTHEAQLRWTLKLVPGKYKNLIHKCLTLDNKKSFKNVYELETAFNKINTGLYSKFKKGVATSAKFIIPTAIAAGIIGFGIYGAAIDSRKEPKPTMSEILQNEDYSNFSLGNLDNSDKEFTLDILVPYMEKAKIQVSKLESEKGFKSEFDSLVDFSSNIHRMPKRLTSAWLMAGYISKDKYQENYKQEGEERLSPSLVPKQFVQINDSFNHGSNVDDRSAVAHGIMYLKQCFGPRKNVADVLAEYFSSNQEINTAKVRTKSINYLPKYNFNNADANDKTGSLEIGYSNMLPHYEQDLINTALALYMITDEEGNTDFNKIPKTNFLKGSYKERLRIPEQ